jgi:hypothetical protein
MLSRDFDPYDLRMRLPVAVAQLNKAIEAHQGKIAYVHCTAGLGRAPGVAVRRPLPDANSFAVSFLWSVLLLGLNVCFLQLC